MLSPFDPAVQTSLGPLVSTTAPNTFDGLYYFYTPQPHQYGIPPDTNGAAGLTQYVQWVNFSFAVFTKDTGNKVLGPNLGNSLWQIYGVDPNDPCATTNSGDIIAQYDKMANRWVMMQPVMDTLNNRYSLCVAVSKTWDATGEYRAFSYALPSTECLDYPKLGIWPDGYYVSYNRKCNTPLGSTVCAFDRTHMLSASDTPINPICQPIAYSSMSDTNMSLLPSDLDGTILSPQHSPAYFMNIRDATTLKLWEFKVDWTAQSSSLNLQTITVDQFSEACAPPNDCIPQPPGGSFLQSMGDRLMYRLAYRNFIDHESLVVNHSVVQPISGIVGPRWYEFRKDQNGNWPVYQRGTYVPDLTNHRWMGSIAMDKFGNMALGYSVSSSSLDPSIRYTGRLSTDALNTMQAETSIVTGSYLQTTNSWGDYSSMSIDPVDDCTF